MSRTDESWEGLLLLVMTDVSTTLAVVIFRVNVVSFQVRLSSRHSNIDTNSPSQDFANLDDLVHKHVTIIAGSNHLLYYEYNLCKEKHKFKKRVKHLTHM